MCKVLFIVLIVIKIVDSKARIDRYNFLELCTDLTVRGCQVTVVAIMTCGHIR